MTVKEMKKRLVGRRIIAFEANAFREGTDAGSFLEDRPSKGSGRVTYDPVFILDDGTRLSFRVHETEIGEYGIDPVIR